ncbi:hypothetical protein [Halorubrum salsamenti]|uniref:hypothetical protein n=1 Tax=Halorubrum salsamenti TaxID=2583990 RepID=UPI0011A86A91|nr:hypothetical protein [Halorubrum salsamenti]
MADLPRRRALLAAASGIAALAGCSGRDSASNSYPSRNRPIDDYELEKARDETGSVLFTQSDTLPSPPSDERAPQRRHGRRVLTGESSLSELTFAETTPAETLRSFCAATDFDAASVYLLATPVDACREVRFRSVSVERDELADGDLHTHADFCQTYRPAGVDCDLDETHTVGFAIRIPVAADRSTGAGRGMSGSCRTPSGRPEAFNGSVTAPIGGDDA